MKTEKETLIKVSFRVDPEDYARVERLAEERGYDTSSMFRELLRKGLERAPSRDKIMSRLDKIVELLERKK